MNCYLFIFIYFFCQQGQTHTARCQKHQTASLQLLRLQLSGWPHCPIYCHSDVEHFRVRRSSFMNGRKETPTGSLHWELIRESSHVWKHNVWIYRAGSNVNMCCICWEKTKAHDCTNSGGKVLQRTIKWSVYPVKISPGKCETLESSKALVMPPHERVTIVQIPGVCFTVAVIQQLGQVAPLLQCQ